MPDDVLLGADLGTSGLKLVALDPAGRGRGRGRARATRSTARRPAAPRPTCAPGGRRFDEALAAVAPALGGRAGSGRWASSGQMHGAVLVDAARAGAAAGAAVGRLPGDRGARPLAGAPGRRPRRAGQPAGRRDDRPAAGLAGPARAGGRCAQAAAVLLPKDALRATLLPGRTRRSPTAATPRRRCSGTSPTDDWSPAAVAAAGVDPALLPAVRPAARSSGRRRCRSGEVPVVTGGADTPLALLAAGTPVAQVNLGTGAQLLRPGLGCRGRPPIRSCTATPTSSRRLVRDGGAAERRLGLGVGVRRARAVAGPSCSTRPRRRRPEPGEWSSGPFLTGERGGVARPSDRGGWSGLHPGTTRADLARAAVEGVAFAIGAAFALLDVPAGTSRSCSPAAARGRAVVQQLLADVLGRPVRHLPLRSASAIGAAVLAGRGVGARRRPGAPAGAVVDPRADGDLPGVGRRTLGRSDQAASGPSGLVGRRSEGGVVQDAVGGQRAAAARAGRPGEVGEPAAGLPDDHVERGEVPERHLGLARRCRPRPRRAGSSSRSRRRRGCARPSG